MRALTGLMLAILAGVTAFSAQQRDRPKTWTLITFYWVLVAIRYILLEI